VKEHSNTLSVRDLPDVEAPKWTAADSSLLRIRRTESGDVHTERLDHDATVRNAPLPELAGNVLRGNKHDVTELELAHHTARGLWGNELVMTVWQTPDLLQKTILMIGMAVEAVQHRQHAELPRGLERCGTGCVHADDRFAADPGQNPADRTIEIFVGRKERS
jgi:hypothetical protein